LNVIERRGECRVVLFLKKIGCDFDNEVFALVAEDDFRSRVAIDLKFALIALLAYRYQVRRRPSLQSVGTVLDKFVVSRNSLSINFFIPHESSINLVINSVE
jgi:hypothetical protein